MDKIKIYMGIPSLGDRIDGQCYAMRDIEKEYGDRVEFVYPSECVHRVFHDSMRNVIVKDFLATSCDILWFIDSDVIPHQNALDMVTKRLSEWEVAGFPCPVWMSPTGEQEPQVIFNVYAAKGEGYVPASTPTKGVFMVDGMGTGCMLIKRSVFEKIKTPYFSFTYNEETRERLWGEDLYFCKKLNAVAIQVYTDFQLVCKHFKRICLLDVNNYALNAVKNAFNSWDRSLRDKLASDALKRRLKL